MNDFSEDDPETRQLRQRLNELMEMGGGDTEFKLLSETGYGSSHAGGLSKTLIDRDKEDVQFEVREIIKSCLQVEDIAS